MINDIEFRIIKSPNSLFAGAEVGVEARHTALNIIVRSTSHSTQYQNKIAAIELIKKEIANKSWDDWFESEPSPDFSDRDLQLDQNRDCLD